MTPWPASDTKTHPATWIPPEGDGKAASRTRFTCHNNTILMLGVHNGARALPDAVHIPGWKCGPDDFSHRAQTQLDPARRAEHCANG